MGLVRRLPGGLRLILFDTVARAMRVEEITVAGDLGVVTGSGRDLAVMGEYLTRGTYSPVITRFLSRFFAGGGTFVDVGANLGFTTLAAADAGASVVAFEPDPANFDFLRRNVERRGLDARVTLVNKAAFSRQGELFFERSDWNFGDHRVSDGDVPREGAYLENRREVIRVPGCRLDDELEPHGLRAPVLLKVDTQGSELEVLRGAPRILSAVDCLLVEFWPYGIRRLEAEPRELIELLAASFGYGALLDGEDSLEMHPMEELQARMRALAASPRSTRHLDLALFRSADALRARPTEG